MLVFFCVSCLVYVQLSSASDITHSVFGSVTDGMPAAFGDFNSDELTDVFVLRDGASTVEILLAAEEEPLLRPGKDLKCSFANHFITSVVPGDFNGDAFMDVLVTASSKERNRTDVFILWGDLTQLNCTNSTARPVLSLQGQPLAIDYNQDMIIDLFGVDIEGKRAFWIFHNNNTKPTKHLMPKPNRQALSNIRMPHAHAFLDINADYTSDLFITTEHNFEIWYGNEEERGFVYNKTIDLPRDATIIGQSLFIDVEVIGRIDLVTPVCYNKCTNSSILVYFNNSWHDLKVEFKDLSGTTWGFVPPDGKRYTDTITLRSGDFNMDGYPDILATLLSTQGTPQSFLLENVNCEPNCGVVKRTYAVRWTALNPFSNSTVMAVFYDFYQDGILDLILVQRSQTAVQEYKVAAFRNSLDYDANFIKVMVLTGLTNSRSPMMSGNLGKKKRTYGTNLPGPRISYKTTTQEGWPKRAVSAQLPQSAHFTLNLPYTIFGLGRTPNFVDTLTVGLSNRSRDWTQIIPNSQMVVIPWPTNQPSKWKAQLFVTPSKLILMSVAALTGVCGLITLIILGLYWKERQEDKKERLQESHRFHFDAM